MQCMATQRFHTTTIAAVLLFALGGIATGCKEKKTATGEMETEVSIGDNTEAAEAPVAEETAEAPEAEAAPEPAGGQWLGSDLYNVRFRVPDEWKVKQDAQGVSATAPDDSTTAILVGSKSEALINNTLADIKKRVTIDDVELQKAEARVIDGMPGQTARGTGVIKKATEDGAEIDQEIQFIAYVVQKDSDDAVTLMIFSEAEMYEAQKEIIEGIGNTLQHAK